MGLRRMVQAVGRAFGTAGAGAQPPGNILVDPVTGNTAVVGINPADPAARVVQVIGGFTSSVAPSAIIAGGVAVASPSVRFDLIVTRNGQSGAVAPVLGELVMIAWAVPGDQAGVFLTAGTLASYQFTNVPAPQTFGERGVVWARTNASGRITGKVICVAGAPRNVTGNVMLSGAASPLVFIGAEGINFGDTP